MPTAQVEIDGAAARATVRSAWPNASSSYTGASTAQVYDPGTGTVLGDASGDEFVVERAWIVAAKNVAEHGKA